MILTSLLIVALTIVSVLLIKACNQRDRIWTRYLRTQSKLKTAREYMVGQDEQLATLLADQWDDSVKHAKLQDQINQLKGINGN